MRRDHDPSMLNPKQPVIDGHFDCLTRKPCPDRVALTSETDPTMTTNLASRHRTIGLLDQDRWWFSQPEPIKRDNTTNPLMPTIVVITLNPLIDRYLGLSDRVEDLPVQELGSQCLMPTFDLPGRCRRTRP